jgi:hypothetical protein
MQTKQQLFELGLHHIRTWCELNSVTCPEVRQHDGVPTFSTCAYYRNDVIDIWVNSCASVGLAGRSWSYPGYVVDRTPYGVLAHELGHHVDAQHGPRGGFRSHVWRPLDGSPMTGYCPNDNEWFAEIFRLFVTNPDLFQRLRPRIQDLFFGDWPHRAEIRSWVAVLTDSARHIRAAENKIKVAR